MELPTIYICPALNLHGGSRRDAYVDPEWEKEYVQGLLKAPTELDELMATKTAMTAFLSGLMGGSTFEPQPDVGLCPGYPNVTCPTPTLPPRM